MPRSLAELNYIDRTILENLKQASPYQLNDEGIAQLYARREYLSDDELSKFKERFKVIESKNRVTNSELEEKQQALKKKVDQKKKEGELKVEQTLRDESKDNKKPTK